MVFADQVREHMDVIAADGAHVGTVDHLEDQSRIKLTKNDLVDSTTSSRSNGSTISTNTSI